MPKMATRFLEKMLSPHRHFGLATHLPTHSKLAEVVAPSPEGWLSSFACVLFRGGIGGKNMKMATVAKAFGGHTLFLHLKNIVTVFLFIFEASKLPEIAR